ncbi:MAG: hypothetical protein WCI00_08845 [bacterium]
MKSKKTPQGKKEIKKTKKIVKVNKPVAKKSKPVEKKVKPVAKKISKPTVTPKQSNIPLTKPIKVIAKSDKIHKIPDLFKDFYRE